MKFLVDENLPPRLAGWLQERGHQAVHVREVGLKSDPELAEASTREGWIIISKDSDFDTPAGKTRVLKLNIGNASTAALLQWLEHSLLLAIARFNNGETFVALD